MKMKAWMSVLWPAFLLACGAELLVFALVDPGDLHWRGEPIGLSRQAVYTAGFFAFWVLATGSSALTVLLTKEEGEVNRPQD
jgi:hypothetical protein